LDPPPPNRPPRPLSLFPPSFSLMIFLGLFPGSAESREAAGEALREGDADAACCECDGCRGGPGGRATMPPDVGDPEPVGDGPVGRGLRILPLGRGVFCDGCMVDEEPALRVDVDEPMETSTLAGEPFLSGDAVAAKARAAGVATIESAGRTARLEEAMRAMCRLCSSVNFL
jgi:hypothetical protein